MSNFSVAMIDTKNNVANQIAINLSQTEAHNMVVDLRSKRDGNKYWIGKVEWLGQN